MEWNGKNVKIVFFDDGRDKVIIGKVLDSDDYTISLSAERTNALITIGKRSITKITEVQ